MAAMTLVEYAKQALGEGNTFKAGVIELYYGSSSILEHLPFVNIPGNSISYNREESMPGIGFRGINEAYTPSTGIINPLTERLVIAGGELDVDKFIVQTLGSDRRTQEEARKIKALSRKFTANFINGDTATNPRVFDGIKTQATGGQIISAGSTANGAALSLAVLDAALDQCEMPTHFIMSKAMSRKFSAAARTTAVSGYVTYSTSDIGRRVMEYNGIPILTVDLDDTSTEIMPFTEAAASGTNTATSIYVVSMSPDSLTGIQNGGIQVEDLGTLQTAPVLRTRLEWYVGIAAYNPRSIVRIKNIGDLAIVA